MSQIDDPGTSVAKTKLVLVVGSGRSGTSSVAGTLQHLGLHVPQPEVVVDTDANPRGYFEPRWAVDFQKELLLQAEINTSDARPAAVGRARKVCRDADNIRRLREWLAEQTDAAAGKDLVVKDPRSLWFVDIWREAAGLLDLAPCALTMLRHPAEVSSSKQAYNTPRESETKRRAGNARRVAGWINLNLTSEAASRGTGRVFVRYVDLLDDWRKSMRIVGERLELSTVDSAEWTHPHPVDSFIDPSLRRHQITWDEVDVPAPVREVAEEVWVQLNRLVDNGGDDAAAHEALDGLAADYARVYADAEGLARDSVDAAAGRAGPRAQLRRQATGDVAVLPDATKRGAGGSPGPSKRSVPGRPGRVKGTPAGPAERLGRRVDRVARAVKRRLRRG